MQTAARLIALALATALPLGSVAAGYRDNLDQPAIESRFAAQSLLNGLALAGKRIVAVGQRGHVVYSDDAGGNWRQATVPVSSDLVAVSFPTADLGWAVGHDGIVLNSTDGGATWKRQLDGRMLGVLFRTYYQEQAARGALGSQVDAAALLAEVERMAAQGPENAFLDVWFSDAQNGYVVGAFNLILRTADGGKTWEPWFHRMANPTRLHLYSIRPQGGQLYVVGEQGLLMKLDARGERFVALDASYRGTWFGLVGRGPAVLAYGLRGNVFRSVDGGRNWHKVDTGLRDGVTAAAVCGERRLVLVSQSGRLLVSDDSGEHFRQVTTEQPVPASAIACLADDRVVIAGPRGVNVRTYR